MPAPPLPIAALALLGPPAAALLGAWQPGLGALAKEGLVAWVAVLIALGIATAEPGPARLAEVAPALGLAGCNLVLCPLAVHLAAQALEVDDPQALVLLAAGPAAGSVAMVAAFLRLPTRPLLLAQLLGFLLLPLSLPLVAGITGQAAATPAALFGRVLVAVALPALAGLALRRALGARGRRRHAGALGLAGALALLGIGAAVGGELARAPGEGGQMAALLAPVLLVCQAGAALGALVGLAAGSAGLVPAMALGGSVRNFSLVWGASAGLLPAQAELALAVGTLWTLLLPAALMLHRLRAEVVAFPAARP